MADLFTYIVYFSTLILTVGLIKAGYSATSDSQNKRGIAGIPLLAFFGLMVLVLVVGLRDSVGADFDGYVMLFIEQPFFDDATGFKMEWGYMMMVKMLSSLDLGSWSFFLLSAFITYFFLLKSFKNFEHLAYLGIFFFMTYGFLFFTLNGVRQGVAITALGLGVCYIQQRKLLPFLIIIILGGLIHKSLFLFVPLYFVLNKVNISIYVWCALFGLSLIMRFLPVFELLNLEGLTNLLSGTRVDYSSFPVDELETDGGITLGYLLRVFIGLFILIFYTTLKEWNKTYLPYLTLTLLGVLLYNAFSHIHFFSRLTVYFSFFSIFTLAFIIHYLTENRRFILRNVIVVFFLLLFTYSIYYGESGASPFKFISQF